MNNEEKKRYLRSLAIYLPAIILLAFQQSSKKYLFIGSAYNF